MDPSLTFGIELEFICVYKESAFTSPNAYPTLVPDTEQGEELYVNPLHALWFILNSFGIPASGWEGINDPPVRKFSTWEVTSDVLELSKGELACVGGYEQCALELSSPVFRLDDPQAFSHIQHVLEVLGWIEKEFGCAFVTNESCGFHVHVGCGEGVLFPVPVVKRVFQLCTAHERNIDELHAASRVTAPNPSSCDDVWWRVPLYAPLSFFHTNKRPTPDPDVNVFDWLTNIEHASSAEDVGKFFRVCWDTDAWTDGHASVVNFDNLYPDVTGNRHGDHVSGTIEFRQHVGTLDLLEIQRYVLFLGHVMTWCIQARDEYFIALLIKSTDSSFTIKNLMQVIGVPAEVIALFGAKQKTVVSQDSVANSLVPRCLTALKAYNAREVAANKDSSKTDAIRDDKWRTGYYGFNQIAGALHIGSVFVHRMINNAAEQVVLQNPYLRHDEASSQARGEVLAKLANIHRNMDNAFGVRQAAVFDELGELIEA